MTTEQLLLVQLSEELSEVQKEIAKALRFGLDDTNPKTEVSNLAGIRREMTDVVAVIDELSESHMVYLGPYEKTTDLYLSKRIRINQYLEYSQKRGVLTEEQA